MSASPDGSESGNSPRRMLDEYKPSLNSYEDHNAFVERRITDLSEQLSTTVNELSKDKQLTNKKIEELATNMKKTLADIESGLSEQLNLMEESLSSGDFNACPALNHHQIESMDEITRSLWDRLYGIKDYIQDRTSTFELSSADPISINKNIEVVDLVGESDTEQNQKNMPLINEQLQRQIHSMNQQPGQSSLVMSSSTSQSELNPTMTPSSNLRTGQGEVEIIPPQAQYGDKYDEPMQE